MVLPAPRHVQIPGIQDPNIHFTWDDWDVEDVDMPLDEVLQERLQGISQRAVATFAIATGEWVIYRFDKLSGDPDAARYVEAAWAQSVDFRYLASRDIEREEWSGPVRGPIGMAIRRFLYALHQAERGDEPSWRANRAAKLAEHVLTDPDPYREWREEVLHRLEELYPLDPNETLGDVVPREALDPEFDFAPERTEPLINRFLDGLDYEANPFLNSPEEMFEQGFKGTPYMFDIEKDRRDRFDW